MPVSLTAPEAVRAELRRGLEWNKQGHGGDGLKPATVAWARRLAGGAEITRDKAVKMRAWLARHESDKSGKGFTPGDGYPSPGRVAWALWGGDPAVGWSAKLVRHFEGNNMEKRNYTADQRRAMADKGEAMPDGSFPIADKTDLMAAMRSIGRAADPAAAKKHIRARAKALGLEDSLGPAFQKAARVAFRKGYQALKPGYYMAAPILDLPIPCTPADLTPGMQAGYPPEMQADFCGIYNALTRPIPDGAGMANEMAFCLTMDRLRQRGWCEAPGEQWYRVEAMGLPADYETDETGETDDTTGESSEEVPVQVAQKALADYLETLRLTAEERGGVLKVGRMISAANHAKLKKGHQMITDGAALIKGMMPAEAEATDDGGDDEATEKMTILVEFDKANTNPEKKQVFGYAYVAKGADGKQVVDHSGDVADVESLEKAIYANFGKLTSREVHKRDAGAHIIESAWLTHDKLKKMGIPTKGQPDGAWWVGVLVTDDALWEKIKSGEYQAFSLGGSGKRTPIQAG